ESACGGQRRRIHGEAEALGARRVAAVVAHGNREGESAWRGRRAGKYTAAAQARARRQITDAREGIRLHAAEGVKGDVDRGADGDRRQRAGVDDGERLRLDDECETGAGRESSDSGHRDGEI